MITTIQCKVSYLELIVHDMEVRDFEDFRSAHYAYHQDRDEYNSREIEMIESILTELYEKYTKPF